MLNKKKSFSDVPCSPYPQLINTKSFPGTSDAVCHLLGEGPLPEHSIVFHVDASELCYI